MLTLEEINAVGKELEELFCLRTAPMAVKLIDRDEVPEGCRQSSKEGIHCGRSSISGCGPWTKRTRNMWAAAISSATPR